MDLDASSDLWVTEIDSNRSNLSRDLTAPTSTPTLSHTYWVQLEICIGIDAVL